MSNLFGSAVYSPFTTQKAIRELLEEALKQLPKAVFILCCDESFADRDDVSHVLKESKIPIFGGVFPSILWQREVKDQGCIIVPVLCEIDISVFPNLASVETNQFYFSSKMTDYQSAMVLVDGLSRNIDIALNQLLQELGTDVDVFGGAAGSISFQQKPCLFTNQGLLEDAMLVISLPRQWDIAIGHGWEIIDGPFLATQVDNNRIQQLNFQPASDVYTQVIKTHKGANFDKENFFDVVKSYPFGLNRLDDDMLVRGAMTLEGTDILCVGQIPENALLYILSGEPDRLIEAAVESVIDKTVEEKAEAIIFDCISRKLFLGESFNNELSGIHSGLGQGANLFGALVLGEIASGASGGIHFHNKTSVTAITKKNN